MGGSRLGEATVLLVEDEDRLRSLVAHFLRSEGLAVTEAADGGEALVRYAEDGPFDIILLDLNLPIFSGVEVCRRIRQIDVGQPVIICSAAIVHDHERALAALGVTHYLSKPYHPDALLDHIAQELGSQTSGSAQRSLVGRQVTT